MALGTQSVPEGHSWVRNATMSDSLGSQSVRQWRSWVLQAAEWRTWVRELSI